MAPTGNNWSVWGSIGGFIVGAGQTSVTLDFSLTGITFPTSRGDSASVGFRTQVRYFDGNKYVTEQYSFGTNGGSVTVEVGEGLSNVSFRVNAEAGGPLSEEVRIFITPALVQ